MDTEDLVVVGGQARLSLETWHNWHRYYAV